MMKACYMRIPLNLDSQSPLEGWAGLRKETGLKSLNEVHVVQRFDPGFPSAQFNTALYLNTHGSSMYIQCIEPSPFIHKKDVS